jgi:KipI family sensor histidine kinase inhibitor
VTHPLLDGAVIRPSGEGAFAVEFGEAIDAALAARVRALDAALARAAPEGLRETVPTHRSLLVLHDPDLDEPERLLAALPEDVPPPPEPATWSVPVCLEGEAAEDAHEAAAALRIPVEELRGRLLGSPLRVAMFGFAPGFAYLSGLDPALAVPRRATPRPPMPAGSLIAAGGQAALASVPMPTGWYVLGRTALRLFDPGRDPPVPFAPGDRIALRAVAGLPGAMDPERIG